MKCWVQPVASCPSASILLYCLRPVFVGTWVNLENYLRLCFPNRLPEDGAESSFDGLVSTSNHLVPAEQFVTIKTSRPIWWCAELRGKI